MEMAVVINDESIPRIMTVDQGFRELHDMMKENSELMKECIGKLDECIERMDKISHKLDKILAKLEDPNSDLEAFRRRNQARIESGQCM